MSTAKASPESDSFAHLISDLILRLNTFLVSQQKSPNAGSSTTYILYCAGHVLRCADGYVVLRNAGKLYPAKMLIRPAIEAMFRLHAVRINPALLFQIAYTEHKEDLKFARALAKRMGRESEMVKMTQQWEQLEKTLFANTPPQDRKKSAFGSYDAAMAGGMEPVYELFYRLYCQYTHASLRAVQGSLERDPQADDFAISTALTVALVDCASLFTDADQALDLVARHASLKANSW